MKLTHCVFGLATVMTLVTTARADGIIAQSVDSDGILLILTDRVIHDAGPCKNLPAAAGIPPSRDLNQMVPACYSLHKEKISVHYILSEGVVFTTDYAPHDFTLTDYGKVLRASAVKEF